MYVVGTERPHGTLKWLGEFGISLDASLLELVPNGFCKFKSAKALLWPPWQTQAIQRRLACSMQDHGLDREVLGLFRSCCMTLCKLWVIVPKICPWPVERLNPFIFLFPGHPWEMDKKREGSVWGFHEYRRILIIALIHPVPLAATHKRTEHVT